MRGAKLKPGRAEVGGPDNIRTELSRLHTSLESLLSKIESLDDLLARAEGRAGQRGADREMADLKGPSTLAVGNLVIEHAARRVFIDGEALSLSPREYRVLHTLARHAGRMVPHGELLRHAWGPDYVRETHYVRVYVARLRAKLDGRGQSPGVTIESVRGEGYRLVVEENPNPTAQPRAESLTLV